MMKKMFKVLCPIERKDGTTFWMRVGTGFPNRDDSVNLYLDVLPANMKLQLREVDDDDLKEGRPTSNKEARARRPANGGREVGNGEGLPF